MNILKRKLFKITRDCTILLSSSPNLGECCFYILGHLQCGATNKYLTILLEQLHDLPRVFADLVLHIDLLGLIPRESGVPDQQSAVVEHPLELVQIQRVSVPVAAAVEQGHPGPLLGRLQRLQEAPEGRDARPRADQHQRQLRVGGQADAADPELDAERRAEGEAGQVLRGQAQLEPPGGRAVAHQGDGEVEAAGELEEGGGDGVLPGLDRGDELEDVLHGDGDAGQVDEHLQEGALLPVAVAPEVGLACGAEKVGEAAHLQLDGGEKLDELEEVVPGEAVDVQVLEDELAEGEREGDVGPALGSGSDRSQLQGRVQVGLALEEEIDGGGRVGGRDAGDVARREGGRGALEIKMAHILLPIERGEPGVLNEGCSAES